jgi:hypothetical protein
MLHFGAIEAVRDEFLSRSGKNLPDRAGRIARNACLACQVRVGHTHGRPDSGQQKRVPIMAPI